MAAEGKTRIGIANNNVAEYEGVIAGLLVAANLGIRRLVARLDSELAVRQMRGEYRVGSARLKPLCERVVQFV